MISKLHERLGTAGFAVAVIALIAALAGTAFAAAGLNGKQKKEVKKIAKQFAGKNGAPGATGPAGPKGDKGDAGASGTNGTNGTDGTNGTNGKNVTLTVEPEGTGNCEGRGGTKVEVEGDSASKKFVCNGKAGTTGFTTTLPEGKTETGVWGTASVAQRKTTYDVSFPIPLAEAPTSVVVTPGEMADGTGATNGCPWDGTGTPTADAGTFCVYEAVEPSTSNLVAVQIAHPEYEEFLGEFIGFGAVGASEYGAALRTLCSGGVEAECVGFGAWAVTAPVAGP